MKLLLTFLLLTSVCFGQSKKVQIADLNKRVDSLNTVLSATRDNAAKEATELNKEITVLKGNVTELENTNAKATEENEKLKTDLGELTQQNLALEAKLKAIGTEPVRNNQPTSSTTYSPNSSETNTTTTQSNDPFAGGGNGNTFGNDSGTGTNGTSGSGSGTVSKGRVRLNDPVINDLKYSSEEYIYLKLTIDGQGNVISAYNIIAKTTTTDQKLINRIIYEVKKQVKYSKDPGSALTNVYLPAVHIQTQ